MTKYAIKTKCKDAYTSDGCIVTKSGHEVWVCNEQDSWVEATGQSVNFSPDTIPCSIKVFDSKVEAEIFIKKWKGHPWYYVPNGEYEVVEVEPQYKQITVGHKEKYNEQ